MAVDFDKFDVDNERARLRKMSDEELIREGQAARFLCAPNQNFGKPPREQFVIALRLCKEECRQRAAANTHAGQVGYYNRAPTSRLDLVRRLCRRRIRDSKRYVTPAN